MIQNKDAVIIETRATVRESTMTALTFISVILGVVTSGFVIYSAVHQK